MAIPYRSVFRLKRHEQLYLMVLRRVVVNIIGGGSQTSIK
jgi:hypothetical protein